MNNSPRRIEQWKRRGTSLAVILFCASACTQKGSPSSLDLESEGQSEEKDPSQVNEPAGDAPLGTGATSSGANGAGEGQNESEKRAQLESELSGVGAAGGEQSSDQTSETEDGSGGSTDSNPEPPLNEEPFVVASTFVISQTAETKVNLGARSPKLGLVSDEAIQVFLASGPEFAKTVSIDFRSSGITLEDCSNVTSSGSFDVTEVVVEEDLAGTGSQMSVQEANGEYRLAFDGLGKHLLHAKGFFEPSSENFCLLLSGVEAPFPMTRTYEIEVKEIGGTEVQFRGDGGHPQDCQDTPMILLGHELPSFKFRFFDKAGEAFSPANISSMTIPFDVSVQTTGVAKFDMESTEWSVALTISGEPQEGRIMTPYGPAGRFQMVDHGAIDDWELSFFSSAYKQWIDFDLPKDGKIEMPLPFIGVEAYLTVGGKGFCMRVPPGDFTSSTTTPAVCGPRELTDNLIPSSQSPAEFFKFLNEEGGAESCEIDFGIPAARGGQGLNVHISALYQPGE